MTSLTLASVLLFVVTGCGSESASKTAAPAASDLNVTVWPDGHDGQSFEWTLTCEPAGGSHPNPAEACAALAANEDALEPDPPDAMCTQIYGGPQLAGISGLFRGRKIQIELSRANGCAIARWDRLQSVVAPPA